MQEFVKVFFKEIENSAAEILMAELSDEGFYAFEQNENTFIAYCKKEDFTEKWRTFLPENMEVAIEIVENKNWNAEWESGFQPVVVEDFAAIRADFHAPISTVKHELIITPKMSFGTGHHSTTFLMIQAMSALDFRGKSVIDFGTGTGVLAILAEKLGAEKTLAIDYDEWSVRNTEENLAANFCKKINIIQGDHIPAESKADIILANINFNVLSAAAEQITQSLMKGGFLLISGFYTADADSISIIFKGNGLEEIRREERQGWCVMLIKK